MTNVFDDLVSQSTGRTIRPETLELLGKEASSQYIERGTPLNDAIVKLASDHSDMTSEHVRRVVEFANHQTYATLFEKEAGPIKNVVFPYADAEVILSRMKKEATPQMVLPAERSYDQDVSDFRESLYGKEADAFLANAFGVPLEKNAEVQEQHTIQEWHTMRGGMEHLAAEASGVEVMYDQACSRFDTAVKQAMLEGHSLEEVGVTLEGVLREKTAGIRDHLLRAVREVQLVAPDIQVTADPQKIAHLQDRVVNPSTELAQSAHFLSEVTTHRTLLKQAQKILREQLEPVEQAMKETVRELA